MGSCSPLEANGSLDRNIFSASSGLQKFNGRQWFRDYNSTRKMKVRCSAETYVGFQRTTRPYIPEDGNIINDLV
jgi:hypothetical protein